MKNLWFVKTGTKAMSFNSPIPLSLAGTKSSHMNWKILILASWLISNPGIRASAQQGDKVGYADLQLLLNYMPESTAMNQRLQEFSSQLELQLKTKKQYAESQLAEYQQRKQTGATENDLKPLEKELIKLEQEIREFKLFSEPKIFRMKEKELEPILKKLEVAIKAVAVREQYTFILNKIDNNGQSIIVDGKEKADLTRAILKELGIEINNQ